MLPSPSKFAVSTRSRGQFQQPRLSSSSRLSCCHRHQKAHAASSSKHSCAAAVQEASLETASALCATQPNERPLTSGATATRPKIVHHRAFEPYKEVVVDGLQYRYPCDMVEIDVCLDGRGRVVLQHDMFDAEGTPLNDSWQCAAPSLEELLERLPRGPSSPGLMVDIKGHSRDPKIIDLLCEALGRAGVAPQKLLMSSFNQAYVRRLSQLWPELPRAYLTSSSAEDDHQGFLSSTQTQMLILDENSVCRELVERVGKNDIQVMVYTVNREARMRTIAAMGVAGIITDYPQLAR